MRKYLRALIEALDIDDLNWMVLVALAIGVGAAWDTAHELERRVAALETPPVQPAGDIEKGHAASVADDPRMEEPCGEDRLPTATEWGQGSLTVEPEAIKTTCEHNGPAFSTITPCIAPANDAVLMYDAKLGVWRFSK